MEQSSAPAPRAFWVVFGLLGAVLLMEVLMAVMLVDSPRVRAGLAARGALPVVTGLGVLLYSRFVRYAGGALLLAMALYSLWSFLPWASKVGALLTVILIVGAVAQALAGLGLLFWRAFSVEFNQQRQNAPPWVAKVRLGLFVAVGVVFAVTFVKDVVNIVQI